MKFRWFTLFAVGILLTVAVGTLQARAYGDMVLASVAADGTQGNSDSSFPSLSDDGRYVVFTSFASNLVPNDTNDDYDVFLRDNMTGAITLVSVSTIGVSGNGQSLASEKAISGDGRYVVFHSLATDLVPTDTNSYLDVFIRDLITNTTQLISAPDGGEANQGSSYASISANGRYIVFNSEATNLVLDDTDNEVDMYVYDMVASTFRRISVRSDGSQATPNGGSYDGSITDDGRYVVFESYKFDLVSDDNNNAQDIFLHDLTTGTTKMVSRSLSGEEGNELSYAPDITPDGRYITFTTLASNLAPNDINNKKTDIMLYERSTGEIVSVSVNSAGIEGNEDSYQSTISANGRYIVFSSDAANLTIDDTYGYVTDVFLHDRVTGITDIVSRSTNEDRGPYLYTSYPAISSDGRFIAFESRRTDFVANDTNNAGDIFLTQAIYSAPTLAAEALDATSVSLAWNDPETSETNYVVERSTDGGTTWVTAATLPANTTTFVNTGLTCDTSYAYRVYPIGDAEPRPSNVVTVTTAACPVSTPDVTPDVTPDTTPEVTPDVTPDVTPEVTPDTTPEVTPEPTSEVTPEVTPEPTPETTPIVTPDPTPDPAVSLLVNSDFETNADGDKLPDGWTGQKLSRDKLKCNKPGGANSGMCAFVFKGSARERSKLSQPVADVTSLNPGDTLTLSVTAAGKSAGKGLVKLVVTYADGTKQPLKLPLGKGTYAFTPFDSAAPLVLSQAVTEATVTVMYKGKRGKLTVDDVTLTLTEAPAALPNGFMGGF